MSTPSVDVSALNRPEEGRFKAETSAEGVLIMYA